MDQTAQPNFKKIGIIAFLFLFFFIPLYFFGVSLTKPNAIDNLKAKLGLEVMDKSKLPTTESKTEQAIQIELKEEGPTLYVLDLIYDPATNRLAKEESGQTGGHLSALNPKPSESEETFNLKLEVIYDSEVVDSGWLTRYKDFITKSDGKYHFKIFFPYTSESKIKIYSIKGEKLLEDIMQ